MNKIKNIIMAIALVLSFGLLIPNSANAMELFSSCDGTSSDAKICADEGSSAGTMIAAIVKVMMFAVGVVSVIMIIFGGLLFTGSAGNATNIEKAKKTILYSVVGLVVSIASFAIVSFVVARF